MQDITKELHCPLFDGLQPHEMKEILDCMGYHIDSFEKGKVITFENETIRQIGIILAGSVDMVKEDLWGNKTMLVRMRENELFGETFACGGDPLAIVAFVVSEDAKILFLPFERVMNRCTLNCKFHHRMVENMLRIIADKNRSLMRKVEVVSKKTLREKIQAYLSIQSQEHNSRYFESPLGRVELAEYLCADRSALTRELTRMKDEGLIAYDKNCYRIL